MAWFTIPQTQKNPPEQAYLRNKISIVNKIVQEECEARKRYKKKRLLHPDFVGARNDEGVSGYS